MNKNVRLLTGLFALVMLPSSVLADDIAPAPKETLFDNVAKALSERFYDEAFREKELPELIRMYRERAIRAKDFEAHRDVVQAFLSNIPATHLGLIAAESREHMMGELIGRSAPSFGFELIEYDGKQYAFNVLEGGPADVAGLERGDRIMTVDGVLVENSPRLGWRTDDAFLPDPPVRNLKAEQGDTLKLRVERTPGAYSLIDIPSKPYCAWDATKASARIIEKGGKRIALIHFWLIQMQGPDEILIEKLDGEFASCDALVLDLRGRGGSGTMIEPMMDALEGVSTKWNKPIAALINGHSRSAKEIISYEFRKRNLGSLVGERTAGAVIPASMSDVGFGMHLMFPTFTLGKHTDRLEFDGVRPDVAVAEVGPYSAGADPILEAGIAEAIRLSEAAEWKERRETKRLALAEKSQNAAPEPRRMRMHAPSPGSKAGQSLAETKALLEADDEPGYDTEALDTLAKVVDALGGEQILRRHQAKTIRGNRSVNGMASGPFEMIQASPNRFLQRMEFPGMGEIKAGYDGKVGWETSPHMGKKLTPEDELADAIIDGDVLADLNYRKNHRSIRHLGLKEFGGKQCHALRFTKATGSVEVRYIDASSYLPHGSIGEVRTNMGPMVMIRNIEAYDAFDGEMIATKYIDDVGGMQKMLSSVTEVSFDPVNAKIFAPPEGIE